MKALSENQINFLLEYFFKNEEFPGWKNIAIKLLNTGTCIVAGKKCIWKGGISNFIKTKEPENAIDCLLYEFDLDYFLTSKLFKETKHQIISYLLKEIEQLNIKYEDICELK